MKKNNKKQYIHKIPLINKIILSVLILFLIYIIYTKIRNNNLEEEKKVISEFEEKLRSLIKNND